jgi:dipeptidase E
MKESGLADLLPSLGRAVYVGVSAGSMALTPRVGEDFVRWNPPTGDDRALGMVDFSLFPHVDHESMPDNSMAHAERWAAGLPVPAYAIDDQTAVKVTDGAVDVVSEGHWRLFPPSAHPLARLVNVTSRPPLFYFSNRITRVTGRMGK